MFAALHAPGNLPILLDCARQFSPLIETASADLVTFDIRGLGRCVGTVDQIAKAIERKVGIPARLAIASNPDTANYLARSIAGSTVVPCGREAEYLAPLSLLYLGCPAEIGEILTVLGLQTFGQFAQLPLLGMAARLGEEGVYWHELARGVRQRQLRVQNEPVRFFQEYALDDALTNLEPLLFLLSRFLLAFCLEMRARFLAASEVKLVLDLEGHPPHACSLKFPVPMQQHKALLKLVRLELEERPPQGPIRKLRLELMPVASRTTQEEFFSAAYPHPEQLELTLARVRQIVGAENIGSPELLDSHLPDGFIMRPFMASARTAVEKPMPPPSLAFRRFRPPEPAQVQVAEQPVSVVCRLIRGPVQSARGPWFTSGHWWAADIWSHEEWDVALSTRALFRIFRDLQTDRWFVEGNYD